MPFGLIALLAGLAGGVGGYEKEKRGREKEQRQEKLSNADMILKLAQTNVPLTDDLVKDLGLGTKVPAWANSFQAAYKAKDEADKQSNLYKTIFELGKDFNLQAGDDPSKVNQIGDIAGKMVNLPTDKAVEAARGALLEAQAEPPETVTPPQAQPSTGLGKDLPPIQGQAITIPKSKVAVRGIPKPKEETPHTVKLNKDEQGKESKVQHEWQWNPKTNKYDIYVGPASTEKGDLTYHMEKREAGKNMKQDYRVFTDKQGNIAKEEKVGEPYKDTAAIAEIRIPPFQQGQVPGLVFNRKTGKYDWTSIPQGGADPRLAGQVAAFGAQKQLEKDYGRVGQAIKQSNNNAKALMSTSSKFERSNYPGPNRIITWLGTQAGSPEEQKKIGQFKVALLAFSREYMRITTGAARSVSELTVGAQENADTILSKFDSWNTLKAKVEQAQTEINNVDKSYKDQLTELNNVISGKSDVGGEGQPPSKRYQILQVQ